MDGANLSTFRKKKSSLRGDYRTYLYCCPDLFRRRAKGHNGAEAFFLLPPAAFGLDLAWIAQIRRDPSDDSGKPIPLGRSLDETGSHLLYSFAYLSLPMCNLLPVYIRCAKFGITLYT